MGRSCAVLNCPSGHDADIARRKRLGLRQTSLFTIPKRNNALQTWSIILGRKLATKDVICELHFSNDMVLTEDRTILPDGTVHIVPRQRYGLARNAVPIAIVDKENDIPARVDNDCNNNADDVNGTDRHPSQSSYNSEQTGDTAVSPMDTSWGSGWNDDEQADDDVCAEDERRARPTQFVIDDVFLHLQNIRIPETWSWVTNPEEDNSVVFVQIDPHTLNVRLRLILHDDLSVTAHTADRKANVDLQQLVQSTANIEDLLKYMSRKTICEGSGLDEESRDQYCPGILSDNEYTKFIQHPRCGFCRRLRRTLQNSRNRRKSDAKTRYARSKHASRVKQQTCTRLRSKVKELRREIFEAKEQCAAVGEQALNEAISNLSSVQQEAVRACFAASKQKTPNQRRYSLDWVYECLLMRIKNSKLYEHLRSRNILPLPCQDTLNRYIRKLDSAYGFQKSVFDCLKLKSSDMDMCNRRGTLLIDEMCLSEAISLDRQTLKYNGFVYLGDHTPENQENIRGDHALVFMFQPFRGKWVQILGCFLTKNSVRSKDLQKLMIECLILLSNSGFHADVVTMDGAQWNRGVWKLFEIREGQLSCEHPANPNERLRMISDFPHLIKCFRNAIVAFFSRSFQTPFGLVNMKHFDVLLTREGYTKPNMSVAYKLTPEHLNPKGYQKMNVPLAFELFSARVAAAMELYMNDPKCPELRDAAPTITFIKVVGNLIRAMMSRTPAEALRLDETCKHKKAIEDFMEFLQNWQDDAKKNRYDFPISASTVVGLKVTLGSTLELLESLHRDFNFDYLMTARLNQDALERFFGMVRSSCGSNDHPDPVMFGQVFRLLCSYSLVKPSKGSNVRGTELLQTLMETKESLSARQNPKKELFDKLDGVIEAGRYIGPVDCCSDTVAERDHNYLEVESTCSSHHLSSHDYDVVKTSEEVQSYIAGYVARKIMRITRCNECIDHLKSDDRCERDRVIDLLNRYDGLVYPSEELFRLTRVLERVILEVVGTLTVKENTLHQIVERVSEMESLMLVGCNDHAKEVTKKVVTYYLVMRATFLAESVNQNCNQKKIRSKINRKNAKL